MLEDKILLLVSRQGNSNLESRLLLPISLLNPCLHPVADSAIADFEAGQLCQ